MGDIRLFIDSKGCGSEGSYDSMESNVEATNLVKRFYVGSTSSWIKLESSKV
ncbi:hypothetical protein ACWOFR_13490 [Carnobacterium gallinarum]